MKLRDKVVDGFIYYLCKLVEYLNDVVFRLVNWRDNHSTLEIDPMDLPEEPDSTRISLREIDLGHLYLACPMCTERTTSLLMGLGLSQQNEEDAEDEDFFDFLTVGVVAFPCGDIIYSECLTDKVGRILNAHENYSLKPEMFTHLMECETHGVFHNEE